MKMNRTMKLKLSTFVCLTALLGSMTGAQAFCVNNETDIKISASQYTNHKPFGGLNEFITPGDKRCCNWQNDTCNKEGKENSPTAFTISYMSFLPAVFNNPNIIETRVNFICNFTIPANGTIAVTGKNGNYRCESR